MRGIWGTLTAAVTLAAPAQAAIHHQSAQAEMRLDTSLRLTRFTVAFVPSAAAGLRVVVDAGGRDLERTRVVLHECDAAGCRRLAAGDVSAAGTAGVDVPVREFNSAGREDLLVRLHHAGRYVAKLRLTELAWETLDGTAFGIRTSTTELGRLRSVRVDAGAGTATQTTVRTRAAIAGPRTTRALLFAQPNLFADQVQARGLRSERRLSTSPAEHRLDGPLEMRGGELFQVVGELRHRSDRPADGSGLFRITLPRPLDHEYFF